MKKTYIKHVPFDVFEEALHYVQDAQTFVDLLNVYQKEKVYWYTHGHSVDSLKKYIVNGIAYLAEPWEMPEKEKQRALEEQQKQQQVNKRTLVIYNILQGADELTADDIRKLLAPRGIKMSNVSIGVRLHQLELQDMVTKRKYHTQYTTKIYWSVKKDID